jgi:RNA polymerase sigma-70 factor, ECF subfamily
MTEDIAKLSDEEIVKIVREKDQELYSEIIRRFEAKLARYLRRFIVDSDETQDVLQEVFIKTFRNLYGFDLKRKFSSWIYRIAHNEALNHLKKNGRTISLSEQEYKIVDEKLDLKKEMETEADHTQINNTLDKLKEKYREPLILYFFEDKSYEEIGDILHLPTSTVGTLIARGKKQLRKKLGGPDAPIGEINNHPGSA